MSHHDDAEIEKLQLRLVEMQLAAAKSGQRAILVLEGRDGAGKDGTIARITEHLSVRSTRVVALPKPTERERGEWYFQRYVRHLPSTGELVIFNRSWYNRGGVETVMGFCSHAEHKQFLKDAPRFEKMLIDSGIHLTKAWLDIGREEQAARLEARRSDPLKALKISDLDAVAQTRWDDYTAARDEMLLATHTKDSPWFCVRADHKKRARPAVMRLLLRRAAPREIARHVGAPAGNILFKFEKSALGDGRLAR